MPARHIIGCVVHASCALREPGFVQHHFGNRLIIGEPSGEQTARVQQLAALLEKAGFEAVLSEQIQKDAWYKLWGNMTVNPVSAMTGATTDLILNDELVRGFISAVMLEAREIGGRIGIPIEQQPEDRHQVTRKLGAFKTSMLQDVEAGKPVEIDALVTVVKEMGEMTGVPTPFTDALLGLSRLHARVHDIDDGMRPSGAGTGDQRRGLRHAAADRADDGRQPRGRPDCLQQRGGRRHRGGVPQRRDGPGDRRPPRVAGRAAALQPAPQALRCR